MRANAVTPRMVTINAPTITVNGLRSAKLGTLAHLAKTRSGRIRSVLQTKSSRDELSHRARQSKGSITCRAGVGSSTGAEPEPDQADGGVWGAAQKLRRPVS